jgi:co-chaperonin GroES (HSP10)
MLQIKKAKPMFNKLIVTADRYEANSTLSGSSTLLDSNKLEGTFKEYQKVVAVGDSVRVAKVGDTILIDPSRYIRRKYKEGSLREDFVENPIESIEIPSITMDGVDYLVISDTDIAFILEEFEELPDPQTSSIIQPKSKIIL